MITGTTNTCSILTNDPFVLSGLSQSNLSTINVTDDNGLDVSECFGITTNIITVVGDNVTLTGDCNTSLEIIVTEGVSTAVDCNHTGFTQQPDSGLILFEFTGDTTSYNIHPDCCTALGYVPEIGDENYYVCRWRDEIDVTDCTNYTTQGQFVDEFVLFTFITGGTTTVVPSVQCCYDSGYVEFIDNEGIHCVEEDEIIGCQDLVALPPNVFGEVFFTDTSTPLDPTIVTTVPLAECCTSLGEGYVASPTRGGAWTCSFEGDSGDGGDGGDFYDDCTTYYITTGVVAGTGVNEVRVEYIDCDGETALFITDRGLPGQICSRGISRIVFTPDDGDVQIFTPDPSAYFPPRANVTALTPNVGQNGSLVIGNVLGVNVQCADVP